jgi:integral membrane protein
MYLLASALMKKNNKWVENNFILVLIASIIPFGTFVVDYKLKNKIIR